MSGDEESLTGSETQRIYILPTKYGLVYAALVGGMLLGSLNYNNNLGFLLSFLLVGQGLVVMIHTWRNLRGLRVTAHRAPPAFAGGAVVFPLTVAGPEHRPHPAITIETRGASPAFRDLERDEIATFALSLAAPHRGEIALGRLQISSRFPLGLFRAWTYLSPAAKALVYPRPAQRGRPRVRAADPGGGAGDTAQGSDDFVGLRGYRRGDSPRQIDWKALARERGLVTKQFGGNRSERVWIDWGAWPGVAVEERLGLLCRAVLDAAADSPVYGLRLPGREIAPDRGETHRHRCLAALARFGETR